MNVGLSGFRGTASDAQAPLASGSSSHESQPPKITWEWAPPTARGGRLWSGSVAAATPPHLESGRGGAREPRIDTRVVAAPARDAPPCRYDTANSATSSHPRSPSAAGTATVRSQHQLLCSAARRTLTKTLNQTYLTLGVLTHSLTNNTLSSLRNNQRITFDYY